MQLRAYSPIKVLAVLAVLAVSALPTNADAHGGHRHHHVTRPAYGLSEAACLKAEGDEWLEVWYEKPEDAHGAALSDRYCERIGANPPEHTPATVQVEVTL